MADSMLAMPDSTTLIHTAVTPAPQASGPWPVDSVTGQTIINGEPVAPEAANVGTSYTVPAPEHTRRVRGIMIQATLWAMEGKRSARERPEYRPQTTGPALGQQ